MKEQTFETILAKYPELIENGLVLKGRQVSCMADEWEVWGPNYVERAHYLRIHMSTQRHKLEKDPARPRFL